MTIFDKIKRYASIIITIVAVICLFALAFLTISLTIDLRNEELYAQLIIGFMMQCLMIGFWLPEGKRYGEKNEGYIKNKELVTGEIAKVSTAEYYAPLAEFCKFATEENITFYIEQEFAKINVAYSLYNESAEYKQSLNEKVIKKCESIITRARRVVKPINPNEITTCSTLKTKYDTTNYENKEQSANIVIKVITSLITTFIGATFCITTSASFVEGLVKFGYWLLIIGSAIFFSITSGYKLVAEVRNDYFLRLIDFFNRFHAWHKD